MTPDTSGLPTIAPATPGTADGAADGPTPVGALPADAAITPGWSRRAFLRLAGAASAGAAVGGCGPTAAPPAPRVRDKVQLVYQDWRTDWFPPMAQELLEQFHAQHPNIRVFYTPDPENVGEKTGAAMEAGSAPDVFAGCCDYFPIWAQRDYCLDLRRFVAADLDAATIAEWDAAQYRSFFARDGRQFGLPKYHGALALYFNKDVFDAARVAYPTADWTYDDYRTAMGAVTSGHDADGRPAVWGSMLDVFWDRIQIHVNGFGGHLVDPDDPARCRMADPPAIEALEWLRARIWDDRVMAGFLDVENMPTRDAFAAGRLAMVEDGSWALKDILTNARFRVGVAPFPAGPRRRVTLATTDGFGIYAGTRHPEAAWELLKFLIGADYGRAMARANFLQPARVSLVADWIRYIRDEFPEQTRDMDLDAFAHGQRNGYSVTAEIFANMGEAARLAEAAWDRVLTLGQAPVAATMAETCRAIDAAQRGSA